MARRFFAACIFALAFLLFAMPQSFADSNSVVFDFSDDFSSYARMVAQLNQGQQIVQTQDTESGKKRASIQLVALLCKTDGRKIDFEPLLPSYIIAGPRNCFTLFFSSEELCLFAVSSLLETDGIIYAEPDCEVHANSSQGDESNPSSHSFHSWGASQMNLGNYLDYTEAWGSGSASVAVIDSGVFPHSLIRGKLLSSGYDYVDDDEDSSNDLFGHGTNVAGIIADCTVDEPVYIYPIKVLNSSGSGKMSNVVNAVWEAKQRGVSVINLSLESTVMSEALDDAILEAVSSGIIVVVAAGNSSCNTSEVCPAHLTDAGVIVVGAAEGSDGSYTIASYSNYGSSVDVYAFGTGISCCSRSGGYTSETGTSMAAPHVSALCALMHLIHPGLTPGQAEQRLQRASLGTGSVIVSNSLYMIPTEEGFSLSSIRMSIGDRVILPSMAFPQTSCEAITYQSSDENIVVLNDGVLETRGLGAATITATCHGFEDVMFQVTVNDSPNSSIDLPGALEKIEDEAFYGTSFISKVTIPDSVSTIGNYAFESCDFLNWISIPETVADIGDNTFSGAIILCFQGSPIHQFAIQKGLQYITAN